MATIGHLKAILSLNSSQFERGARRSIGQLMSLRTGFALTGRAISGFGAAIAGIGGVAGFGFALKRQLETLDDVAKTSDRLNIAADRLIGFQFAAEQGGSSAEEMTRSLEFMLRAASEAADGNKELVASMAKLGIDARRFVSLPTDEKLLAIADGFEKMGNTAERFDAIRDIMGRGASGIINVLAGGRKELEAFVAEARKFGFAFDRKSLENVERANDAMNKAKRTFQGIIATIGIHLAPVIEAAANWLSNIVNTAAKLGTLKDKLREVLMQAAVWVGKIADFFRYTIPEAIEKAVAHFNFWREEIKKGWFVSGPFSAQDRAEAFEKQLNDIERKFARKRLFSSSGAGLQVWIEHLFRTADELSQRRRAIFQPPENEPSGLGGIGTGGGTVGFRSFKELGIVPLSSNRFITSGGGASSIAGKQLTVLEKIYGALQRIERKPVGMAA